MVSCEPQQVQRRDRDLMFHVKTTQAQYTCLITCPHMYLCTVDNSLHLVMALKTIIILVLIYLIFHHVTSTILIF